MLWLKSLRMSLIHTACTRNRYSTSGDTGVMTASCNTQNQGTVSNTQEHHKHLDVHTDTGALKDQLCPCVFVGDHRLFDPEKQKEDVVDTARIHAHTHIVIICAHTHRRWNRLQNTSPKPM